MHLASAAGDKAVDIYIYIHIHIRINTSAHVSLAVLCLRISVFSIVVLSKSMTHVRLLTYGGSPGFYLEVAGKLRR